MPGGIFDLLPVLLTLGGWLYLRKKVRRGEIHALGTPRAFDMTIIPLIVALLAAVVVGPRLPDCLGYVALGVMLVVAAILLRHHKKLLYAIVLIGIIVLSTPILLHHLQQANLPPLAHGLILLVLSLGLGLALLALLFRITKQL